jgi:hypothetical protein
VQVAHADEHLDAVAAGPDVISRGTMWNRSSGSADGATATSRLPSSEFMRARPSWYSWPKKRQSWASQSSTMRRSGSMQSSVAAQPFG